MRDESSIISWYDIGARPLVEDSSEGFRLGNRVFGALHEQISGRCTCFSYKARLDHKIDPHNAVFDAQDMSAGCS